MKVTVVVPLYCAN